MPGSRRRATTATLLLAMLGVPCGGAWAQGPPPRPRPSAAEADERAAAKASEKAEREAVLSEIERRYGQSSEARRRLEAEVAGLKADGVRLVAALLAAAARTRETDERIRATEERLDTISAGDAALRLSLAARGDLIAEILAALQRMTREPAPPVLVRPDDILAASRAATLLGATVPALREEAEALAADLRELARLRDLAAADRLSFRRDLEASVAERARLAALVDARREQLVSAEAGFGAERARSEALGREAKTLRDLVDRLDAEIGSARREAAEARRQAEAEQQQMRERLAAASARDPVRLAPKIPFADARGTLGRPIAGPVLREFGMPDPQGAPSRGISIAARAKAIVTSSCDGSVVYAGPFRSFGRLLIIDAGGGYYLLLAGLDRITVETGQFVLAGEPVGQMGEAASSSAALGVVEAGGPVLYVELRKDGGPIDPGPWWMKSQGGRVRG